MSNPLNNLEREFHQSAERVRRTPSPGLRHRTLSRLQEMACTFEPVRRPSSRWALAVYALLMTLTLSYAYLQIDRLPHTEKFAGPAKAGGGAPMILPSLPKWSIPQVQVAMAQPLKDEWDSLSRDAERTIDQVRQQIARLPRLDSISPASNEADRESTDLR